jgi:hypothetical protein
VSRPGVADEISVLQDEREIATKALLRDATLVFEVGERE